MSSYKMFQNPFSLFVSQDHPLTNQERLALWRYKMSLITDLREQAYYCSRGYNFIMKNRLNKRKNNNQGNLFYMQDYIIDGRKVFGKKS